jgi:hypothetical protein
MWLGAGNDEREEGVQKGQAGQEHERNQVRQGVVGRGEKEVEGGAAGGSNGMRRLLEWMLL